MKELTQQIGTQLKMCGLQSGSVVMVHASLKSLSHIPQHPEGVIKGILHAIGESGTLLMPALSYESVTADQPHFDVRHTPSNVGALAEYFRQQPGVLRSLHPTHSVAGIGRYAHDLLIQHSKDTTPVGRYSPFSLLPEYEGKILLLGCGLKPNTSMHGVEELVEPPYLYDLPIRYTLTDADGHIQEKWMRPHYFKGFEQRYDRMLPLLKQEEEIKIRKVMSATIYLIDAKALWEKAYQKLQEDPLFFVDRISNGELVKH